MGRWICYIFAATISLLTIAIVMVQLLFRWNVRPQLESVRIAQDRHYQAYLGDLQFLSRGEISFGRKQGAADAGQVLNHLVYWSPDPGEGFRATPLVSNEVRETLMRFKSEWMKKYERVRFIKADLSLFKNLFRFDHWDLEVDSPIANLAKAGKFIPPAHLPSPETSDLLSLVKLRLMNGALNGDFTTALGDVRSFARLLLTTENTQLVLTGLAALDYERFAYRFYVDERGMEEGLWQPIDRNLTRRAHRAILATRAFLHLWTEPEHLEKVYLGPESPVGFCASVNDTLPAEFALRSRLEPHWPLEVSLKSEYKMIDRVFQRAKNECRLRYLTELINKHAIRARIPGPLVLTDLPYSRKIFGLRSSVLSFEGLDAYEASPL